METMARKYHRVINHNPIHHPKSKAIAPEPIKSLNHIPDCTSEAGIDLFADNSIYVCCNSSDIFFTPRTFRAQIKEYGIADFTDEAIAKLYGGYDQELATFNSQF